jgi:hypothetical protein
MTDGLDAEADRAFAQRSAEAGATWWVENITPNRWRSWEGFWPLVPGSGDDWPLEPMRERIRKGPPR